MASLSSSSVSGSNSLGNTSLRGFGGLASGIDRDALIEQMTLSTNTKIENQKSNMTKHNTIKQRNSPHIKTA